MPLGKRFVTVDYLAKEGRVEPNPFLLKEEASRAYEVQNKQEQEAENNINREDSFSKKRQKYRNNQQNKGKSYYYDSHKKNRVISYSHALSQLYSNLQYFCDNLKDSEIDSAKDQELKNVQRKASLQLKTLIQNIYQQVLNAEYPKSIATFSKYKIETKTPGDPQKFDLNQNNELKKQLSDIVTYTQYLIGSSKQFYKENQQSIETMLAHGVYPKELLKLDNRQKYTVLPNLSKYTDSLAKKLDGKTVRQDNEEVMDNFRRSIGKYLIKDDSRSDEKIDRQKAEQDIANKLSPYGMQLVVRKVQEQTPEEELVVQTKTSVLRAAWDGYIEQPKNEANCSDTLKNLVSLRGKEEFNKLPTIAAEDYNLSQSKVWEVCQQMPVFKEAEDDLRKALSQIHFPANKLQDLSYQDVAWLINAYHTPSAADVKARQDSGQKDINGYMLKFKKKNNTYEYTSGKKEFYKNFIKTHEYDFRKLLEKQEYSPEFIDDAVEKMKKGKAPTKEVDGKTVELFNAHHNFPISDPDYFEKSTPDKWTDMNSYDNIVLMDKDVHDALHSTENNVTKNGYIDVNGKESNRTIFTDSKTGEQFYYVVQVNQGIKAITGFNSEIVYKPEYLNSHIFENGVIVSMDATSREIKKAEQEQAAKISGYQTALQHAKERKADLENRKSDGVNMGTNSTVLEKSCEKAPRKERGMGRPNFKGLGNYGASSPQGNRRGRS